MQMGSATVSVAVLAGGRSSRMGTDKAFVQVRGRPMIEHVLDAVRSLGSEIFLVTNRPDGYRYLGLRMVGDILPDRGSLGGLYTAAAMTTRPYVLTVACDMPFLSTDLLGYMISLVPGFDAVVPRIGGIPEPLHSIYGKACLAPMRARLDAGRLKIAGFYEDVSVRYLDEAEVDRYDPQHQSFRNLNTLEEVKDAGREQA